MSVYLNRELKYVIHRFAEDPRQEVGMCVCVCVCALGGVVMYSISQLFRWGLMINKLLCVCLLCACVHMCVCVCVCISGPLLSAQCAFWEGWLVPVVQSRGCGLWWWRGTVCQYGRYTPVCLLHPLPLSTSPPLSHSHWSFSPHFLSANNKTLLTSLLSDRSTS